MKTILSLAFTVALIRIVRSNLSDFKYMTWQKCSVHSVNKVGLFELFGITERAETQIIRLSRQSSIGSKKIICTVDEKHSE